MQTIGRTSVGTARKDDNRIDQAGGTIRCDKSRESYGANGCRNSFLKTPILPIAPQTIMRSELDYIKTVLYRVQNCFYII